MRQSTHNRFEIGSTPIRCNLITFFKKSMKEEKFSFKKTLFKMYKKRKIFFLSLKS